MLLANLFYQLRLTSNLPTYQLAVSQVADWSTRKLVNSLKVIVLITEILHYICTLNWSEVSHAL